MLNKWAVRFLSCFFILVGCVQADSLTDRLHSHWKQFKESLPGSALVSNKLECGGLILKNFQLDTDSKYTIASPGEMVSIEADYEIVQDENNDFDWQDYVYGLHSVGPIDNLASTENMPGLENRLKITFNAPEKKGIYQLRVIKIDHKSSEEERLVDWENTSSNATIAIIVVD